MVPVLSHGAPIGLLEAYCAEARSWTRAEINRARIICHQLGPVIDSFGHVQRLRVTA
jgi:GAF domain-containing protein